LVLNTSNVSPGSMSPTNICQRADFWIPLVPAKENLKNWKQVENLYAILILNRRERQEEDRESGRWAQRGGRKTNLQLVKYMRHRVTWKKEGKQLEKEALLLKHRERFKKVLQISFSTKITFFSAWNLVKWYIETDQMTVSGKMEVVQ